MRSITLEMVIMYEVVFLFSAVRRIWKVSRSVMRLDSTHQILNVIVAFMPIVGTCIHSP